MVVTNPGRNGTCLLLQHWQSKRRSIAGSIGVRANIHLGGGADRVVGGGGSSRNFPGSIFGGGGGSSRNFPGSILCGVGDFFPLPAVTDPRFVLFKHVLYFARIIICRLSVRIHVDKLPELGGGQLPPLPPPSRTPMLDGLP